jgi:hypothetical protein
MVSSSVGVQKRRMGMGASVVGVQVRRRGMDASVVGIQGSAVQPWRQGMGRSFQLGDAECADVEHAPALAQMVRLDQHAAIVQGAGVAPVTRR